MCLVTLLLMSGSKASAQKKFELGFRLMPSFASFDTKTSTGGTIKGTAEVGFGAGAFLGINFSDNVGAQVELQYTSISQKYTEMNVERKIKLSYINIPVLLALNTGKSKAVNFGMVLGPQLGINAGSSITSSNDNGTNSSQAILAVKKSDISFAYGAGLDFALNQNHTARLGIGYRGSYGLLDISDNSNTLVTNSYYILDRSHIMVHSAYIGISYLFL